MVDGVAELAPARWMSATDGGLRGSEVGREVLACPWVGLDIGEKKALEDSILLISYSNIWC